RRLRQSREAAGGVLERAHAGLELVEEAFGLAQLLDHFSEAGDILDGDDPGLRGAPEGDERSQGSGGAEPRATGCGTHGQFSPSEGGVTGLRRTVRGRCLWSRSG